MDDSSLQGKGKLQKVLSEQGPSADNYYSANTVILILTTWSIGVILEIYRAILKSFCPSNSLISVLSSERMVMTAIFHRTKAVWFRVVHLPMGKN